MKIIVPVFIRIVIVIIEMIRNVVVQIFRPLLGKVKFVLFKLINVNHYFRVNCIG